MPNPDYKATAFPTPISSTCTLLLADETGYAVLANCTGVPPTTANIFQAGCLIMRTDTGLGAASWYKNDGTIAAPVWSEASGVQTAHAIYDFAVDGGAIGAITPVKTAAIPDNAIIVGATLNSTTALTSLGSATVAVGTTAGSAANAIKTATAIASLGADALVNGTVTFAAPVKMTAPGSVNLTVATAALTAGVLEVFVYFVLPKN